MEKKLQLHFTKCIQDSQELGSDNEHAISRLFFDFEGKSYTCDIRQPYGESFSYEDSPLEVVLPQELKKVINYGEFREIAEFCYRKCVGAGASGISISGCTNVRMMNNTFGLNLLAEVSPVTPEGGW